MYQKFGQEEELRSWKCKAVRKKSRARKTTIEKVRERQWEIEKGNEKRKIEKVKLSNRRNISVVSRNAQGERMKCHLHIRLFPRCWHQKIYQVKGSSRTKSPSDHPYNTESRSTQTTTGHLQQEFGEKWNMKKDAKRRSVNKTEVKKRFVSKVSDNHTSETHVSGI